MWAPGRKRLGAHIAYCWNTRTGSSVLRTETAGKSRIFDVRPAAAARTVAGDEEAKSGRWCSPRPNTIEPNRLGQHDFIEDLAETFSVADRFARDGVRNRLGEAGYS